MAELSRRSGVSYQVIDKLKKGRISTTSVENAEALSKALGMTGFSAVASIPQSEFLSFGEALVAHMKTAGVRGAELSRATGVSHDIIKQLTSRRSRSTTVENAIPIANFFGVSVDEFLGFAPRTEVQDSERASKLQLSEDEQRLIRLFARLSAEEREELFKHIVGVLDGTRA